MVSKSAVFVTLSMLLTIAASRQGLHLATHGLLQIHPSFSNKGVFLYPGHHPDHDSNDLEHLTPKVEQQLHYAQEGHRPAFHGAKHGSMKASFNRPTVVLDHIGHVRSVQCNNSEITIAFKTPEAFEHAERTWNLHEFHLATYHVGCGDEYSGKRSYFLAKDPRFYIPSKSVTISAVPIEQKHSINAGEITWGTYKHPEYKRDVPVRGHVRLVKPRDPFLMQQGYPRDTPESPMPGRAADDQTLVRENKRALDLGQPVDLNNNVTALVNFFQSNAFDVSDIDEIVSGPDAPQFIDVDGTVETEDENGSVMQRDQNATYRAGTSLRDPLPQRHHLQDRDVLEFFEGLYNGIKDFFNSIVSILISAVDAVQDVTAVVFELAIVAAKLIAVPFGVPFDHSYHHDFDFTYTIQGDEKNHAPEIFGITNGYTIITSGPATVQCAKCGIHGDFSVDGRLAFNIDDGITDGQVSLINNDPFTIDAIFGITVAKAQNNAIKALSKRLAAVSLSPLAIPGIITLGPEITLSSSLDIALNGQADLLVGGSLSISSGIAQLSLVKEADNKFEGFDTTFTPIAKFSGTLSADVELSLPIAFEVGLDVLNGLYKKTVGIVNNPSIYASAVASSSTTRDSPCNNGVEISAGVKNRIFVQALDLWDYDIRTDVIYESNLGCITTDGIKAEAVESNPAVFLDIETKLSNDIANARPKIQDVAANLTEPISKAGYRIIMDQDKTSILVAGEDGYIYLVVTDEASDFSAPWGTIDMSSDSVNMDVFGRVMAFVTDEIEASTLPRLWDPAKIPAKERAISLTFLTPSDDNQHSYGAIPVYDDGKRLQYTTFCKTDKGLRLYTTDYLILPNGRVRGVPRLLEQDVYKGLKELGGTECKSVRLTSELER